METIFKYPGAIHIHTTYSDGTGDVNTIAKIAKKCGLNWIIITDHDDFSIEEGIYDGVYVIKGEEVSHDPTGHLLSFGIKSLIPNMPVKDAIAEAHLQGGFCIAAHPDEGLNKYGQERKNSHVKLNWKDKNIVPDGIEIWNWFSNWADNYDSSNVFTTAYSYFFRHNLVTKPCENTLKWWDELNNVNEQIIPAIGGCDAHALKITKYIPQLTVFPYNTHFDTINNVINLKEKLNSNFEIAKIQILNALRNGNNVIINKKNCINIQDSEISVLNEVSNCHVGEQIKLDRETYLKISLPQKLTIKVLHNGKEIYKNIEKNCCLLLNGIGKYRIEVLKEERGVLYTNPILLIE